MPIRSEQSVSTWKATRPPSRPHPGLEADLDVDVCVVGAGIAGMTIAYLLTRAGKSVAVLDDGPIGGGQTERTTAHLSNAIDSRYIEIERLHGLRGARLAAESHTAAIERIETIVDQEKIDCGFERLDGYLLLPAGESEELLSRELEAAHRAGLTAVERVERAPLDGFETGPCLRFPRQGQFHPLAYLAGLERALMRDGARIHTAHAAEMVGGSKARVRTRDGHVVSASAVVVATNSPVNDLLVVHTKQAAYMTYVIAASVPRGTIAKALYWDTLDPYHYVRLASGSARSNGTGGGASEELLLIGGEDHKTGQRDDAPSRYARLEAWARERFPMMGELRFRWSGQVLEPVDGLAFIGRNPLDADNVFIATGDSGMGITHGTIAGILITDLILGRENAWTTLYDPSRKTLGAAQDFLKEASNMAWQYTDWLTAGDLTSLDGIAPGSGAVVRRGFTKVAIYRDAQDVLHERSAVCTHLGGIVAWNSSEHTWDCPCHGSRFDAYGRALTGPALSDLGKAGNE